VPKRTFQQSLLSQQESQLLDAEEIRTHRNAAFDLLDALSRSGTLAVHGAQLHVVMASTHLFARTVVDTVVMDNVNPIEQVERSLLTVATTIHGHPSPTPLLQPSHSARVKRHSPSLFPSPSTKSP
jgi:hypothetical protein